MALSVLIPITITDSLLISSNVTENDYAVWSSATTYAVGDRVINTTTHRIYESLQAGNLNKDPTIITNRISTGTVWWLDYAPTNKWAMFDSVVSTQTSKATILTVVLVPGFFNSVYLGGLDADTMTIVVKDFTGGTIIYNSGTITLENSMPPDYYEYFFAPFIPMKNYTISGIPPYVGAEITVTLNKVTGNAFCGMLSVGDLTPLGRTQIGAVAKPKTYSYISTDIYGVNTIIRRKSATDMTASCILDTEEATNVLNKVQSVLDIPCVWIANDACNIYSGLTIFGLGSGELTYVDSTKSELSLTVQGLI